MLGGKTLFGRERRSRKRRTYSLSFRTRVKKGRAPQQRGGTERARAKSRRDDEKCGRPRLNVIKCYNISGRPDLEIRKLWEHKER